MKFEIGIPLASTGDRNVARTGLRGICWVRFYKQVAPLALADFTLSQPKCLISQHRRLKPVAIQPSKPKCARAKLQVVDYHEIDRCKCLKFMNRKNTFLRSFEFFAAMRSVLFQGLENQNNSNERRFHTGASSLREIGGWRPATLLSLRLCVLPVNPSAPISEIRLEANLRNSLIYSFLLMQVVDFIVFYVSFFSWEKMVTSRRNSTSLPLIVGLAGSSLREIGGWRLATLLSWCLCVFAVNPSAPISADKRLTNSALRFQRRPFLALQLWPMRKQYACVY